MKRVRIATLNCLNLALPRHPFYEQEGYSREQYERKISWLATLLDRTLADVVCFQEVFHLKALEDVVNRSHYLRGAHVHVPLADGELPKVGLASRLPMHSIETIVDFPVEAQVRFEGLDAPPFTTFSRPVLKAELALGRHMLHLYGVHFKSRRPFLTDAEELLPDPPPTLRPIGQARSAFLRAAEATALRALFEAEVRAGENVVVLGDFNASERSVPTEILIGGHPPLGVYEPLCHADDDRYLYHVLEVQSRRATRNPLFTHVFGGVHEIVDHILVSRPLLPWSDAPISSGLYSRIYNDHLVTSRLHGNSQRSWQTDHGPVVLTLDVIDP